MCMKLGSTALSAAGAGSARTIAPEGTSNVT
jgi:hypothetical protein